MKKSKLLAHRSDRKVTYRSKLDSNGERLLCAYAKIRGVKEKKLILSILVNDPIFWNVSVDGPAPLFLHVINADPNYDAIWPEALARLASYARKKGYPRILCTGKSCTHSEEAVENHLGAAGYDVSHYRSYTLDL